MQWESSARIKIQVAVNESRKTDNTRLFCKPFLLKTGTTVQQYKGLLDSISGKLSHRQIPVGPARTRYHPWYTNRRYIHIYTNACRYRIWTTYMTFQVSSCMLVFWLYTWAKYMHIWNQDSIWTHMNWHVHWWNPSRPLVGWQNGCCWMPFRYGWRQICNSCLDLLRVSRGPGPSHEASQFKHLAQKKIEEANSARESPRFYFPTLERYDILCCPVFQVVIFWLTFYF